MSGYSVFIPRMFSNIGESRIRRIFHEHNIGNVERVDLVSKTSGNGDTYNMAFVHFEGLYNTDAADTFCQDVENPEKKAKIVYDDPWFWLVLPFIKKETPLEQNPVQEPNIYDNNQPMMTPYQYTPDVGGMWVMTEMGWQWIHYNPYMMVPQQQQQMMVPQQQMIPPQVLYRNYPTHQKNHPRKRICVDGLNEPNQSNQSNNNQAETNEK